ncbi:MAG: flagellar motor switch protein FliN [Rhodobiaceae bacterium]|nr:flagellar motor switch protein FliN [Rhodobiaceae bacterium]
MADQEEGMDLPDLTDEANLPVEEGAEESVIDTDDGDEKTAADLEAVFDVPVNVSAVLGKTDIEISDLLKLDSGTTVELDRKVGEAIDIYVNDRLVARGEVVIVEEQLGVTMTEIIKGGAN